MEVRADYTRFTDDDYHLFNEGSHYRIYEKLGSRILTVDGQAGGHFALWAPNARSVSVIGDFNGWSRTASPLDVRGASGVWEGFVPGVELGACYKYHIVSSLRGYEVEKADPYAFASEVPPKTGSRVWALDYEWGDAEWMARRHERAALDRPIAIYEVHLGSWRRAQFGGGSRPLTYRELAEQLPDYVRDMGFTHVEVMPVMEHPFYGSWGYQTTGYFAPTARYGTPQDLMHLIDVLHGHDIGVILDWVPSHFPNDQHGLGFFDGSHLYEHSDPKEGFHPDWKTLVFNYGRHEVRSFLISNALFWLDKYHADGLRVDAVASMLYRDYSREDGEWIPNEHGGRENIEAIEFVRAMNTEIFEQFPDVQTIAEESTSWPMVSRPTYVGGLGFGLKWDMGWMHDTLQYMSQDPLFRKYHHETLSFRGLYMFHENFVLPLSHDEVVHGKGSLVGKMPGDEWQRFANLRILLSYMYAQPGKKMLFMGSEFGQLREWNHDDSLDWHLLEDPLHRGVRQLVRNLNQVYRDTPALYAADTDPAGFEWVDCHDADKSVISFMRYGGTPRRALLAVCNFTPVPRFDYRVGVPRGGAWQEILNSDAEVYGGRGHGNFGEVESLPVPWHGREHSVILTLPPLAALYLEAVG